MMVDRDDGVLHDIHDSDVHGGDGAHDDMYDNDVHDNDHT